MPPAPQDPQDANKNNIDIGSILLPKKETPGQTPASAQRVNAGALLEQEQSATLLTPKATPAAGQPTPAPKPAAPVTAAPKQPEEGVRSIETYQRDIESVVKGSNVSVLTIAAAEAERRNANQKDAMPVATAPKGSLLKTIGLYVLGFVLLAGASGALAYIIERPTSVVGPAPAPASPFISVDDTKEITISADTTRASLMASLTAAKGATALSLGLMSRLLVTVASSTPTGQTLAAVDAQSFLTLLAPNIPPALVRTINPSYLLGVHVYDSNQPFLILSVDSYEQAYAGMIAWEPYLKQDLAPLFNYTPTQHIPEENIASTTPDTANQFIQTGFVDSIVENHDARVVQNSTGDILLLWTFIDRNTLVITTNDATLREIISRLTQAPITPQGGQ